MQNCTKCKEPIVNLKGGIICAASCYGYFHVECTRIATYRSLSKMGSKKLYWKCDACKLGGNMDRSAKKVQVSESVQSKCVFQTSLKIKLYQAFRLLCVIHLFFQNTKSQCHQNIF